MNKSLLTNLASSATVGVAFLLPAGAARDTVLTTGLFALSGGVTNWLAIHMLFERVPGLYGSGIIPNRFEEFKCGIRNLIMENFFTEANFERLTESATATIELDELVDKISFAEVFEGLVEVIRNSPLGGMLATFGGSSMLDKFREPVEKEMRKRVARILHQSDIKEIIAESIGHSGLRDKVATLVDARLDELTPSMVKEIVQEMIRAHLGWLVVWGGVFGGLMGLLSSLLL